MSTHAQQLGRDLRELREDAGFSPADLARAIGISPSAVSLIENGKRVPRLENLSAWADACGYTWSIEFSASEQRVRARKLEQELHREMLQLGLTIGAEILQNLSRRFDADDHTSERDGFTQWRSNTRARLRDLSQRMTEMRKTVRLAETHPYRPAEEILLSVAEVSGPPSGGVDPFMERCTHFVETCAAMLAKDYSSKR